MTDEKRIFLTARQLLEMKPADSPSRVAQEPRRDYLAAHRGGWKEAEWTQGVGRYGSIADCSYLSVKFFDRLEDAVSAKQFIDRLGCGGGCVGRHIVIDFEEERAGEDPAPVMPTVQ